MLTSYPPTTLCTRLAVHNRISLPLGWRLKMCNLIIVLQLSYILLLLYYIYIHICIFAINSTD